ncbi:hypothetical protein STRIP9103_02877 [Streptomyces ipomoeae 91-03]|uniref:Uncharacterized protein n=1 Tax=Streptomyces ipomoeae 91-03 TaxID=698759 RepID=L1KMN8_9ACTN|nr:hypothetical protein STRIP9103_02877 [Streptomyces ipomoeae 91-03]
MIRTGAREDAVGPVSGETALRHAGATTRTRYGACVVIRPGPEAHLRGLGKPAVVR